MSVPAEGHGKCLQLFYILLLPLLLVHYLVPYFFLSRNVQNTMLGDSTMSAFLAYTPAEGCH